MPRAEFEADVAMQQSDDSDSDNADDNDEEAQNLARLMELESILKSDPYHYQSHVEKVEVLKKLGELEQLRSAREAFSKLYPLTSDLWLDWLRDEQGLLVSGGSDEDRNKLFELFELAVKDYASVEVWLEYCQFSLCGLAKPPEGIDRARDIFEKAISVVGIHVAKGALIWEAYREFETALLSMMSVAPYTEEDRAQQRMRILKLFKRQLTVPLLDMDSTWQEYLGCLELSPEMAAEKPTVETAFLAAKKMLMEREELENALLSSSGEEQLKFYKDYLALESKASLPVRLQSVYERRITDHCLIPTVWTELLDYLDFELKIETVSLPTHDRAVRNCPWSGDLWVSYLRAMERFRKPKQEVIRVFEQAIAAGFADPAEYLKLWLAYIDYRRRSAKATEDNSKENEAKSNEEVQALFAKAVDHLAQVGGDPECRVARYWAWLEGDLMSSMEEARKIWSDIVGGPLGDIASYWVEYINLEKLCGDTKHLRKLYPRALEKCKDLPEVIGESWVQFEREEGTLEEFENAERKFKRKMEKTEEVRAREAATLQEEAKKQAEKVDKRKTRDKDKRRERRHFESDQKKGDRKRKGDQIDNEDEPPKAKVKNDFKVPQAPGGAAHIAPPPGFKGVAPPPGFKGDAPMNKRPEPDESKETRTVFVSNLVFSVTEEDIKTALSSSGDVTEVRLIKHPDGKSKGFAYVEFGSRSYAQHALTRDHEVLQSRPMFISECDPDKKAKGHQFKYGVGLEKNKLFVKGLPITSTKEDLEKMFGDFGKVKEVRIVTYRNGHSKGIAFIEYEEESAASTAILKMDRTQVDGNELSVAISNPPERRVAGREPISSLGGGTRASKVVGGGQRAKVAFLPRALIKPKTSEPTPPANGSAASSNTPAVAKSNADFRNMLLGDKK